MAALVNSLGATPPMELYIVAAEALQYLKSQQVHARAYKALSVPRKSNPGSPKNQGTTLRYPTLSSIPRFSTQGTRLWSPTENFHPPVSHQGYHFSVTPNVPPFDSEQ